MRNTAPAIAATRRRSRGTRTGRSCCDMGKLLQSRDGRDAATDPIGTKHPSSSRGRRSVDSPTVNGARKARLGRRPPPEPGGGASFELSAILSESLSRGRDVSARPGSSFRSRAPPGDGYRRYRGVSLRWLRPDGPRFGSISRGSESLMPRAQGSLGKSSCSSRPIRSLRRLDRGWSPPPATRREGPTLMRWGDAGVVGPNDAAPTRRPRTLGAHHRVEPAPARDLGRRIHRTRARPSRTGPGCGDSRSTCAESFRTRRRSRASKPTAIRTSAHAGPNGSSRLPSSRTTSPRRGNTSFSVAGETATASIAKDFERGSARASSPKFPSTNWRAHSSRHRELPRTTRP